MIFILPALLPKGIIMKINNKIANALKKDFPIFGRALNGKRIIYLDNAATTQKPDAVVEKVESFYEIHNANVHRGMYSLGAEASNAYDDARKTVAKFISADVDEVIFTKGTTESINLLSYTISSIIPKGRKKILLTDVEHHANLIPWQELAKRDGFKLEFVKLKKDFTLDEADLKKKLDRNTAIFAFAAASNTIGTVADVAKFCKLAKGVGAISVVDGAQSVPHTKTDVKNMTCDFLAFSSHKMLGPSGVGVLYGRRELLKKLPPFNFGGAMIGEVKYESATYASPPERFEAGTPNMEGAVGLAEAILYLQEIGLDNIEAWEKELTSYALKKFSTIKEIEVYHPGAGKGAAIISFNIKGVHAHDVASLLDDYGVCTRAGFHCAMPLISKLGLAGTVRVSFYFYNTFEDIDALVDGLKNIVKVFRK
jgi:cysteine desulfurase/selenocysteine lyase